MVKNCFESLSQEPGGRLSYKSTLLFSYVSRPIRLNIRRSLQFRILPTTCEQQPVSSNLIPKQYDKHCDVMVLSSGMHHLNPNPNSTFQLTCMDTGGCRTVPRFHRDTHTVSGIFQGQTHSAAMLLSFLAIFSFATCTPRSP